jgi:hypothetical protein
MDLDFNPVRTSGRASAPVLAEVVRPLLAEDLEKLAEHRGTKPGTVVKLRDSHHALARVLANGVRPGEASIITGYSLASISRLQADPAFQELLAFYREAKDAAFADLQDRMASLSLDALEELRDRLNDSPQDFSPDALLDMIKVLADRTGHAPQKNTTLNVNVNLADRLASARRRVEQARPVLPAHGGSDEPSVGRLTVLDESSDVPAHMWDVTPKGVP